MHSGTRDVAQVRLDNALALFDEFVRQTVKDPDAATLRGLERRFAERLQIQPSYWSQIKSRSRQIGERLARQFEQLCHKPPGWMDLPHDRTAPKAAPGTQEAEPLVPQDDDERFIVGLVLTYYRRHPQRARTRLLDLLGEVLVPTAPSPAAPAVHPSSAARPAPPAGAGNTPAAGAPSPREEAHNLWARSQQGVAPLKRKR
jgi:hypothetical protein